MKRKATGAPPTQVWLDRVCSKRLAKLAIDSFDSTGHTNHSKFGHSLRAVVEHCEANKIPYQLQALPGRGYFIKKLDV